jgi:hypothetical protein
MNRRRALAALATVALLGAAGQSPAARIRGTYRMQGFAHIATRPAIDREVELHADAILEPGARPDDVRAHLAARGHACDLLARIGRAGALGFEAGQRCMIDIDDPDARGRIEARLGSGRGQLQGERLTLELSWELSGTLSLRTTTRVHVPGTGVEIPETWTPAVRVRGEARATAEGKRDESRATER